MRRITTILLFVVGCSADQTATLAGAPPIVRRAPEPAPPGLELCCYYDLCVQPRIEQQSCDRPLGEKTWPSCKPMRIAELGPLWRCLEE